MLVVVGRVNVVVGRVNIVVGRVNIVVRREQREHCCLDCDDRILGKVGLYSRLTNNSRVFIQIFGDGHIRYIHRDHSVLWLYI